MDRTLHRMLVYGADFTYSERIHGTPITHAELKRQREENREFRRLSNGHGGFNRQVFAKIAK